MHMEAPKVVILLCSLISPIFAWSERSHRNQLDVNFKSGYHDNAVNMDEFHKESGLTEAKKDEGGRGFFYFEKGGKKLVGYMDYGDDDDAKKDDPWQSEVDNIKTFTFTPSSDFDKKDDMFAIAKPQDEHKIYYFSNNKKVTMHRPKIMTRSQSSRREQRQPMKHSEMFNHGYSDAEMDIDKRREDFQKEFNQVQVRSNNKWNNFESRRPPTPRPRFQPRREQKQARRQERWRPQKEQMNTRHRMMESNNRRGLYERRKPPMRHARPPQRMQPMRHKTKHRAGADVKIMYESNGRKVEEDIDEYDGKVYIMLPSGKTKDELGKWINSDFFTDTFIESFHPSSIDQTGARQGRLPIARVVKFVPYQNVYAKNSYKV